MGKRINHIGSQEWRKIVGEETFKSGPEERNEARSSTLPGKGQQVGQISPSFIGRKVGP